MSERTVRELGAALGVVISVGCGFYITTKDLPVLETILVGSRQNLTLDLAMKSPFRKRDKPFRFSSAEHYRRRSRDPRLPHTQCLFR
jgi:hypothetical protein